MRRRILLKSSTFSPRLLGTTLLVAACNLALAQQTPRPDAGSILREQPSPLAAPPARSAPATPGAPQAEEPDTGPKIKVQGFRITGATLLPEAELIDQLKELVGQEASFRQLRVSALLLIGYYAQKGYLARVFLPPQDIKDGIVNLTVIEGRRGVLRIENKGQRIDAERVQRYVDARLIPGSPMSIRNLGEALNILNDQPGVVASSSVALGKSPSEIDIVVTAQDKPLVAFGLNTSNGGSRGAGVMQYGGSVALVNPTGSFDALSLLGNKTDGSTFGRLDYSLALGDRGFRAGVNVSDLKYKLTQQDFVALGANGTARTFGLIASYPLIRHSGFSLGYTASYDAKELVDQTVNGETGNRRVEVTNLGFNGYALDELFGGGLNTFGGGFTLGKSNQRNAAALAAESTTRQTEGSFTKLTWNYGRIMAIKRNLTASANLRGQLAGKNLDSSERFALGGAGAIRAYPGGEASGDEGWLLALNLAYSLAQGVSANLFVDYGEVRLNRNLWANWNAGNLQLPNRYALAGWGLGINWQIGTTASLSFVVATPIGSNPGRDVNGNDADGRRLNPRAWLNAALQF